MLGGGGDWPLLVVEKLSYLLFLPKAKSNMKGILLPENYVGVRWLDEELHLVMPYPCRIQKYCFAATLQNLWAIISQLVVDFGQ